MVTPYVQDRSTIRVWTFRPAGGSPLAWNAVPKGEPAARWLRPGGLSPAAQACALMEGGALAGQLVNPLTVLFISHQGVLQRDHSSDSTLPQLPKKEILTFPLEGKGGRETKDLISGLKSTEG